ncbi:hypothetical protein [Carboxylicivirga sp. N1Y90]|uniref:hypothetical protein n=1 Tax=Carboxylicivirga fragile TaxID=3417571 RepID=UPI003D32DF3D|nr:hypothetical protein [Marinilabiliaceae bacterium N1Y90]
MNKSLTYLTNRFLLLIPIFIWNIVWYHQLPEAFNTNFFNIGIPNYILYAENGLRLIVFSLPLFMRLSFQKKQQKIGLVVYITGISIYFSSWLALIQWPQSNWSMSPVGFTAPAYTTLIFLMGMALIGKDSFIKRFKPSLYYTIVSILFVLVHSWHTLMVFNNL